MRISLDRLQKEQKLVIEYEDLQFERNEDRGTSKGPLKISLVLCCVNGTVPSFKLEGLISGEMNFVCDRCGEEFCKDLRIKVNDYFELESQEIKNREIDLNVRVRECVLNSFPIKILCKEDCKGFCVKCRTNLNKERCICG